MCGKRIISRNHTKGHIKSIARENLYQLVLCGNRLVETLNVQKIIKVNLRKQNEKEQRTFNLIIKKILAHNLHPISLLYVVMKVIKLY